MTQEEIFQELLDFFKALSDANRLKIIGLLAQGEHSVSEVAELLDISISTASNHLSMLAHVGLVSARADGHYYYYSLHTEALQAMAQKLLRSENLPKLSNSVDVDAYDSKVLQSFLDADGRITAFPAQQKKFVVLLSYAAKAFEPGRRYPEKEVNEILLRFNKDTASLRRGMIEYHLMEREGGGGDYWRI
jgi:DNA-binding transcriptional ArsR family regulator